MKKYYQAYEDRYQTIHQKGFSWSSDKPTPIVLQTINKYQILKEDNILEIGCGEGRDAKPLLNNSYSLLATDISHEAIKYCQAQNPQYENHFAVLDCLGDTNNHKYKFIYAVAVIHMLVLDEDRKKFYSFIKEHLTDDGVALICSMGDGQTEIKSDISKAFDLSKRDHFSGEVEVASTSCRMVSFEAFRKEINESDLTILEEGITSSLPDFNNLMFVVVKKHD